MNKFVENTLKRLHRANPPSTGLLGNVSIPPFINPADQYHKHQELIENTDAEKLAALVRVLNDIDEARLNKSEMFTFLNTHVRAAIEKYEQTHEQYLRLNDESQRRIALKREELRLDSIHHWKELGRQFFFRVLAAALFVVMLFTIGYIDHEFEWARLPLAQYLDGGLPQ